MLLQPVHTCIAAHSAFPSHPIRVTHWALALDTAREPAPLALALLLATATPLPVAWALLLEMAVPPLRASAVEVATAAASSLRPVVQEG